MHSRVEFWQSDRFVSSDISCFLPFSFSPFPPFPRCPSFPPVSLFLGSAHQPGAGSREPGAVQVNTPCGSCSNCLRKAMAFLKLERGGPAVFLGFPPLRFRSALGQGAACPLFCWRAPFLGLAESEAAKKEAAMWWGFG